MATVTRPRHRSVGASTGLAARRRWGSGLLVAGGLLSALNGATHWALPVIYPWDLHVQYEPVLWALYATTVFFGILLVLGGILTVLVARARDIPSRVVTWIGAGMAAFWALGAGYELAVPFPTPGVRWALPVFSLVLTLLYVAGLWLLRPRPSPRHPGLGPGRPPGR